MASVRCSARSVAGHPRWGAANLSLDEIIDHRRRSPRPTGGNVERITPFYRSIMLEIERRRISLGISMDEASDRAGVADRSYSKILYADAPSGRQATWRTLQDVVDGLFPAGYDV